MKCAEEMTDKHEPKICVDRGKNVMKELERDTDRVLERESVCERKQESEWASNGVEGVIQHQCKHNTYRFTCIETLDFPYFCHLVFIQCAFPSLYSSYLLTLGHSFNGNGMALQVNLVHLLFVCKWKVLPLCLPFLCVSMTHFSDKKKHLCECIFTPVGVLLIQDWCDVKTECRTAVGQHWRAKLSWVQSTVRCNCVCATVYIGLLPILACWWTIVKWQHNLSNRTEAVDEWHFRRIEHINTVKNWCFVFFLNV